MVDHHQHVGLDKLRLHHGSANRHQRLAREHHGALGNRPDISRKAKRAKLLKEALVKAALGTEVGNILLGEVKIFDIVHDLLKTCRNGISAVIGVVPIENVEINDLVLHSALVISVCHGQLVKVTEHR